MPPRPTRPVPLSALAAAALLLAGCTSSGAAPGGAADGPRQDDSTTTTPGPTGDVLDHGADTWPLSLQNCGTDVVLDGPPDRLVAVKSSVLEMVLALGAGERVVGAAFLDGPVPTEWADEAAEVPVVADGAPGREAVLDLEPDLVLAGWESVFSADGVGDREALHGLGVDTYVAPAACKGEHMPRPLTVDLVHQHVLEMGRLLGAEDEAEDLVARQRAELAEVVRDERGLTALWWSSGVDVPYVGAGLGAPQVIMDAVGLQNVAGQIEDTWTSYGWEQVAEADPDVIVLVDATWNTAEDKRAQIEAHPAASRLTAVREGRYLVLPFASTEAGVRTVGAIRSLADQLAGLGLEP